MSNIAQNGGLNIDFGPAVNAFTGSRPGSVPPPPPQQNFNFPGNYSVFIILNQEIYAFTLLFNDSPRILAGGGAWLLIFN